MNYGPNDSMYINHAIREAAKRIKVATSLWCEGHYPHSNARIIPKEHPLCKALEALAEVDKETAKYANVVHDPILFEEHKPTKEAMERWGKK